LINKQLIFIFTVFVSIVLTFTKTAIHLSYSNSNTHSPPPNSHQAMSHATVPATAVEFKPTLRFPNQVAKNFGVLGPSGQILCEFTTEQAARAFMSENKFFLNKAA
jgi:hypothetical protein